MAVLYDNIAMANDRSDDDDVGQIDDTSNACSRHA